MHMLLLFSIKKMCFLHNSPLIVSNYNCADVECALFSLIKSINTVNLLVENKPKKELIRMLQQMGYDSDPVKAWKQAQEKVGH